MLLDIESITPNQFTIALTVTYVPYSLVGLLSNVRVDLDPSAIPTKPIQQLVLKRVGPNIMFPLFVRTVASRIDTYN
jgi:hypothetical protein